MTLPRNSDAEQPPQLSTTRVDGGRRAWLIAFAAVVVLGTFVYLGLSGGRSVFAPRATSTLPAVAALPTPIVGPTPDTAIDPNEIESLRADPTAPLLYQYLGTALTINGSGTLAILDSIGPDEYRGLYRIPVSRTAPTARLEFDAVTASVSHDDLDRIGQWEFPINSIAHGTGTPVVVLDTGGASTTGTLSNPDFNRVLTNGYRLTVTTQNQGEAALMTIDVTVNQNLPITFPGETYSMVVGPNNFGFALENFGPGAYDATIAVPRVLFGQTIDINLVVAQDSQPAEWTREIGDFAVQIVKRPEDAATAEDTIGHVDGVLITDTEPKIMQSGYDIDFHQGLIDGKLNLGVTLNVRPLPRTSPEPTR